MEASDLWYVAALLLAAAFFSLYVRLGEGTATQFARAHYRAIRGEDRAAALTAMAEDDFVSLYLFVRRRRDPVYFVLFLGFALTVTILVLMIAQLISQVADPGPLVWQFMTFFGVIAAWTGAVIGTLWAYHTRKTAALLWWRPKWKPDK